MNSSTGIPDSTATATAIDYCYRVIDGRQPACKWVRLACERQLRDLATGHERGFQFNLERAEKVVKFFRMIRHIKGKWARTRTPVKLEPWQLFWLTTLFGWEWIETGTRRFRNGWLEVPRKNGKSFMLSGLGLYGLSADREPGAEVYSAATSRDQAKIVWEIAVEMVRRDPRLSKRIGSNKQNLHVLSTFSFFQPLSSDYNNLDGLNGHFIIIDELHAHKTRSLYDVLDSSTGARDQPLILVITTAGGNQLGICYEKHEHTQRVLEGLVEDDSWFGTIYTLDQDDDWGDEQAWRKANPNYGVSVIPRDLRAMYQQAVMLPRAQAEFKTKRLNQWVSVEESWLNTEQWKACGALRQPITVQQGRTCYIGLDLSSKIDVTAMILLFPDDTGGYDLHERYWIPEGRVEELRNTKQIYFEQWVRCGHITATPGATVDYAFIEADIKDAATQFEVEAIGMDPWNAQYLRTNLEKENLPVVTVPMNVKFLSEPMKELERLVKAKRLRHGAHPVTTWMMSNVVAKQDHNSNFFPRRPKAESKIDGAVATILALGRAMAGPLEEGSPYEDRDLVVL